MLWLTHPTVASAGDHTFMADDELRKLIAAWLRARLKPGGGWPTRNEEEFERQLLDRWMDSNFARLLQKFRAEPLPIRRTERDPQAPFPALRRRVRDRSARLRSQKQMGTTRADIRVA